MDQTSGRIICLAHGKGRHHDFRLLKSSKVRVHQGTKILADSGYQGLQKTHKNTVLPKKRSKKTPLTREEKKKNREQSSIRVRIENVNAALKRFHILADKYRNRRKRFGLRFSLIAAIYNKEFAK